MQSRFLKHFLPAQRALRAYLHAATGDVNETDDLLQDVSNVLWEKFEQYDESRLFAAWATGIARLQVLKWRQARYRSRKLLSEQAMNELADAAADAAEEADDRPALLAGCLKGLQARPASAGFEVHPGPADPRHRRPVGHQVGAIEMALVRARRAVRDCIERKMKFAAGR